LPPCAVRRTEEREDAVSRNKDAVRLAHLKGVPYATALRLIRNALSEAADESHHAVAVRLIEAEEAKLSGLPLRPAAPEAAAGTTPKSPPSAAQPGYTGLFQEPEPRGDD
jgi:hypothetical protein